MNVRIMLWKKLRLTLDMIEFEHSVFALPFALTGALLAFRESGFAAAQDRVETRLDRGGDGGARAPPPWPSTGWWTPHIDAPQSAHPDAPSCPPGLLTRGFAWALSWSRSAVLFLPRGELNRCASASRRWR